MTDLTHVAYDAAPGLRWSHLKHLRTSPKHFRHRLTAPHEDTPALRLGRALHLLVLEPKRATDAIAVFDGASRRGKAWEAYAAAHADREILLPDEWEQVQGMAREVVAEPLASALLSGAWTEQALSWHESVCGPLGDELHSTAVLCKARVDVLSDGAVRQLVDLKSTRFPTARQFAADAQRLGYHCQLAWYARGLRAAGLDVHGAAIIAVESAEPYDVAVYDVPPALLELADQEIDMLLDLYRECTASGEWPGAARGCEVDLLEHWPRWALPDEDAESGLGVVIGGEEA